ncbi:MAG: zf-HC2 domain-containing protein [Planctomycetes bacterium]|nr:zf-HC2 domain-containing protein [Planctomycetota bacterium]
MEHVNDIELMEYVAGKLTALGSEKVREHLEACKECSVRWRKAVELWKSLGQWSVDTAGHDVADRITALADQAGREQRRSEKTHVLSVGFLPAVLRIAASIIIAVGVGHKLGNYSVNGNVPADLASQNRPEYLAALSLEWSSELAWFILEDDSTNMGDEQ